MASKIIRCSIPAVLYFDVEIPRGASSKSARTLAAKALQSALDDEDGLTVQRGSLGAHTRVYPVFRSPDLQPDEIELC